MWTLLLVIVLTNPQTGQHSMNTVVVPAGGSSGLFGSAAQCNVVKTAHIANLANANTVVVGSCAKQYQP